jgi:plasmid stability protein
LHYGDGNAGIMRVRNISIRARCGVGNLTVRNVDDDIVKALKLRAGALGVSAEAEHRRILKTALLTPKKRSFSEALMAMPNVGIDADFARVQDNKDNNVFN